MKTMPIKARIYIASMWVAGLAAIALAILKWECQDPVRFAAYFVLALLASGLKIYLPGIRGTMSVNFLFILIGILDLSFAETILIGCAATLVQSFYHAKLRPSLIHSSFSVASMACAIWVAWMVHARTIHDSGNTHLLLVAMVACSYFVANTLSVAAVIALIESKSLSKVWRDCYFWCFPYYLLGASIAWALHLSGIFLGWQASLLALPIIYYLYRSYRSYLGRLDDETKHVQTIAALHVRTIEALALAIEAKDDTTHDHLRRVTFYAVEIGKAMGLDEETLVALHAAALLHDIGKLAVPENIISKPGRLKPEEFEKMKIHPIIGAEILDRVQFPYPVVPIVRAHHEKWDGTGYPEGLKGEQIPLGARILSVVDCLDALASDRHYRRALPLHDAMAKVLSESGKSFDPRIVNVLQSRYVALERMAKEQPAEPSKLSKLVQVKNGTAPAAGYENQQVANPPVEIKDVLTAIATARREAQALFELTEELGESLSVDERLPILARTIGRMIPYDALAIYLVRGPMLRPEYVDGSRSAAVASLEIPIGAGLSGWVAEKGIPIVNGNPMVEPGYLVTAGTPDALRSAVSVPLSGRNGVIGVLTLYGAENDAFTKDHLRILSEISSKAAVSVENSLKYREVASSATIDYLTGLPNARSLFVHLQKEIDRCGFLKLPLSVLVCDLDGFKQINDRFGHLEGNKLLSAIALGLKECCRREDYVARLGGDEFVIVMPATKPEDMPAKLCQFTQLAVQAGRRISGEDLLSMSVGQAFYPSSGTTPEQLLTEADREMFQAKRRYKKMVQRSLERPALVPDVMSASPSHSTMTH